MNYKETDWVSIDEIIEMEQSDDMDEEEEFSLELIYME